MSQRKVVISAAITGAIYTPSMSPYLPSTPDQIIQNAVDACRAGAAVLHLHARNEIGEPTACRETFRYILSEIKRQCDGVIGITTGGAQGMTVEERFSDIEDFKPEMASANCGTMNFCTLPLAETIPNPKHEWELPFLHNSWDRVFKNTFKDIEHCIKTMYACGTLPEFEIFDYGQLANLAYFVREKQVQDPIYIQFVPGVLGGMPMSPESFMFMLDQSRKMLGNEILFSTVAGGRRMFRHATLCAINGGNVRVGMEDGIYINPSGELAVDNAAQVLKIKGILEALDFEIAAPDDARRQLNLKGGDKVNF